VDLVVAGVGAVGAPFVELLPSLGLGCVRIVDTDTYGPSTLASQPITPELFGQPKAHAVARRLKARAPATRVLACHARFQDLAVAELQSADALVVSGDNLALVAAASQRACALGQFLIEAGVHGPTCVAQVRRTTPAAGRARACLRCTWDASEERELERQTRFACDGSGQLANPSGPTGALAALSTHAASLMAFELVRWALGLDATSASVEYCALSRVAVVSPLTRKRRCPVEHAPWRRVASPRPLVELRVEELFALAGLQHPARHASRSLELDGHDWVERVHCACPLDRSFARFVPRSAPELAPCPRCGARPRADAFHVRQDAPAAALEPALSLAELGARAPRIALVRGARATTLLVGPELEVTNPTRTR
jgi:molybdopterin/thiamine biosynthesis adenylyltransferase